QAQLIRTNLTEIAEDFAGKLLIWIGQGTNPGQLQNKKLLAQGLPGGIAEAANGVCYAVVTEFTRLRLTQPETALKVFSREMQNIPDRYRQIQAKFEAKFEAFRLATHLVLQNQELAELWNRLIIEGRSATDAILEFWKQQESRSLTS